MKHLKQLTLEDLIHACIGLLIMWLCICITGCAAAEPGSQDLGATAPTVPFVCTVTGAQITVPGCTGIFRSACNETYDIYECLRTKDGAQCTAMVSGAAVQSDCGPDLVHWNEAYVVAP